jgi:hypothetical protein
MKKALFFAALCFTFLHAAADPECGFDSYETPEHALIREEILRQINSGTVGLKSDGSNSSDILYFRLQYHIVTKTDGTGGLDPADLPMVTDMLNRAYKPANIQFVSCSEANIIRNDQWYMYAGIYSGTGGDSVSLNRYTDAMGFPRISTTGWDTLNYRKLSQANNLANALNIYFLEHTTNRGWATWGNQKKNYIINRNEQKYVVVPHEVGHFFGLYHTFSGVFDDDENFIKTTENVARSGTNSNCSVKGDNFCDTPADHNLHCSNLSNDFICLDERYDEFGDRYSPDRGNIMSYGFIEDLYMDGTLVSRFSKQQCHFMRLYARSSIDQKLILSPISDMKYSGGTLYFITQSSNPVILRNVSVSNASTLKVTACETLIEDVLEISSNATVEFL